MTDVQKLKYDLALNGALAKALSNENGVSDEKLLKDMLEDFKEFYRGYNTFKELNFAEAFEYINEG